MSEHVTFSDAEGHCDDSVGAGDSVQTADEVGQVIQHTQVVFHHDDVPGETMGIRFYSWVSLLNHQCLK